MATAIDLVLWDPKCSSLVLCEVKSGQNAVNESEQGKMSGDHQHVPCTLRNQALFQAALGQLLFERTFKKFVEKAGVGVKSIVVRAVDRGVHVEKVDVDSFRDSFRAFVV
jgi:hypothetical protein